MGKAPRYTKRPTEAPQPSEDASPDTPESETKQNIIFPVYARVHTPGIFYFIFSLATDSISLIRLSWLTSLAPGS